VDIRLDEFFVELRRFTYDQPFLFRVLYFFTNWTRSLLEKPRT